MLKVVWNIVKYLLGIFQRILYPAKRLVCGRRKNSASDIAELTSIGTGDGHPMTSSVSGSLPENAADLEMEPWDSWGGGGGANNQQHQGPPNANTPSMYGAPSPAERRGGDNSSSYHYHHMQQQQQQAEPEVDLNFFEDMTPTVQRQKKFLIRNKQQEAAVMPGFSNRLAVTSDVPMHLQTSELESWEDTGSTAWEDNAEATEDISWQADEAIREKKKKDRMERQMEQQRKKQKKDEMRGLKGGNVLATKLS